MEDALADAIRAALARYVATLGAPPDGFDARSVAVEFQTPGNPDHGDLATNVALQLARPLGQPPRTIAQGLVDHLELDPAQVAAVEVAGPGFLNVRFASGHLTDGLAALLAAGRAYGRTDDHAGQTAIVEFVSANPTGPLTVGHGRNAVLGDTFATLLAWTGYDVTREYYFNDAGRQMRMLGQSVAARYRALARPATGTRTLPDGQTVVPEGFPDDGYLGAYIGDVAAALHAEHGEALLLEADRALDGTEAAAGAEQPFKAAAQAAIFAEIDGTLRRMGVRMDTYFNEHTLYEPAADGAAAPVWQVVDALTARGLAYERDGATWFKTSALGKTTTTREGGEAGQDTVLVKSTGEPTYRLPDIAYHLEKLSRGFDLVLDVFGADHIATYPDVLRGVEALGGDPARVDVVVYQFVTLVRNGQPVKMSTRKATYVTLDDLMDEVGEDVTRFFFLMRSPNTHLEFDLALATEASEKNPVFYLQYAHARIASVRRKAAEVGAAGDAAPDLARLTHASETALVKTLLLFPDEVRQAAEARAPHRLATYLRAVAEAFSAFYRDCRIVGEAPAVAAARLALAEATQTVLANGLGILGLSAPDRMDRDEPAG